MTEGPDIRMRSAQWAHFGKQKLGAWDEPNVGLRHPMRDAMRTPERCWLSRQQDRWPWKSEYAKECGTTHLPKQLALKWTMLQRRAHTRPRRKIICDN
ncbi:hypothetical protein HNY73_015660 [Argiope bruennichi]|uniref:Uncharacterized protein n=1 Tax=Argiope bruennichi TaxID=94029 RepID=A0A8T0ELX4_ARGBR|nr:hypothetical protein HNY73_015660 [Argiope bruennichi]